MTYADWIHVLAGGATAILLVTAGITDIRRYRIPNGIVCAIVVAFVIGAAFNLSWTAIGWSLLAGFGMFLVGAGLFALGLFGGGDVKLVAAMALWTGVVDLPRFLLVMTAAGGLLGLAWLLKRRYRQPAIAGAGRPSEALPPDTTPLENAPGRKAANRIPYGVAIAFAGLYFLAMSVRSPLAPLLPWLP